MSLYRLKSQRAEKLKAHARNQFVEANQSQKANRQSLNKIGTLVFVGATALYLIWFLAIARGIL